ncbi:10351_t:CDS:2 [Dentiscutata heterogama]|uniref:10351_t:CDS:1 n=1 Tax=Dentiscutata heterogama TaxID=1316150 RepID=A0ACA9N299_9GLOM|nr:10351_t:CDS:2 [Dentiscutata heterogama]
MTSSSIKNQFETLHNVYLQDTWLQQRLPYSENANLDNQRLYQTIYNEFLDSDLNKSMEPHLPPLIEDKHKIIIGEHQPIILQIADIFEVGVSAQSLLDVVNSYLSGSVKQGHKYNDLSDRQYESIQFPRGMLKFQLTDGYQSVDAIEYKPLSNLNLLTPIGIKISVSKALILRGVLLLGPENVTVLGGFSNEHRSINAIRIRLLKQLGLPVTDCSQEIQPNQEPESTNENQRTQSSINPIDLVTSRNTSTHSLSSQNEPFVSLSNATITESQSESQSIQNILFQDSVREMFVDDVDLFNENVVWSNDSFIITSDTTPDVNNELNPIIIDDTQDFSKPFVMDEFYEDTYPEIDHHSFRQEEEDTMCVNKKLDEISPYYNMQQNKQEDQILATSIEETRFTLHSPTSSPPILSCDISPTEKTSYLSILSQDTDELPSEDEAIASFNNKT